MAKNLIKWIEIILQLIIIVLFVYLMFDLPGEKKIYEECNLKILCELNRIDNPICRQYQNIPKEMPNITLNIT